MIKEIATNHLREKKSFTKLQFDKITLDSTFEYSKPVIKIDYITNKQLIALRTIFEYIFEDFELSESNFKTWVTIYAFPNGKHKSQLPPDNFLDNISINQIANHDDATTKCFIEGILNRANEIKNNTVNQTALHKKSKLFVTGDVGSGKTTFFKYLFSKYNHSIINNHKNFWVHINFAKQYLNRLSIEEAIELKVSRLFREFYFDRLDENEKEKLHNLIKSYFTNDITGRNLEFELAIRNFYSKYDKNKTSNVYHKNLQSAIRRYVEEKYTLTYIIDGLDNLENYPDLFNEKLDDISDIISDPNRHGLYFFVMRNESHNAFLNKYSNPLNHREKARILGNNQVIQIEPVKLNEIIEKRFYLITELWETIVRQNQSSILSRKGDESLNDLEIRTQELVEKMSKYITLEKINAYFDFFLMYLHVGIRIDEKIDLDKWDRKVALTELKDLVGNNFRKLMDAINQIHSTFLQTINNLLSAEDVINLYNIVINEKNEFYKREKGDRHLFQFNEIIYTKSYKVIPTLLSEGERYKHPYYYHYVFGGNLKREKSHTESKFIYNIFYPINSKNRENEFYTLLLKIRILQFLKLQESENNEVTTDNIVKFLLENFPYDIEQIKWALGELEDSLLIETGISKNGYYTLMNTRIGDNHLDKLISNFGYLRIILDDVLVPKGFEKLFSDPSPELFEKERGKWIIAQIPRVALFFKLIFEFEKFEIQNITSSYKDYFQISDRILSEFVQSIERICKVHDNKELSELSKNFTKMSLWNH